MAADSDEDADSKVPLQSDRSPKILTIANPPDLAISTNFLNGIDNDNSKFAGGGEYSGSPVAAVNSYQKMEIPSKARLHRRESHAFAFGFSSAYARLVRWMCGKKESIPDVLVVDESQPPYRTTPRRWIILAVFSLYSMSNAFQWIAYGIISDKIMYFYDVSYLQVDWLSMIYMLAYIPLVFPATWLLDKKGLRVVALIGALGNFLGSAIKCFSAYPDRFVVTFAGQTVAAVSQIFILGLPARLAAVWFSATEVSFATAVGVFGNQLGVALGFLLPPILVPDVHNLTVVSTTRNQTINGTLSHSVDHVEYYPPDCNNCTLRDLYAQNLATMFYGSAAINGFLFLIVLFIFQDAPQYPPSPAQAAILQEAATTTYLNWIVILVKNYNFIILVLSYGINVGAFYGISTLLSRCVLFYNPDESLNAGRIGVTIVLSGLVGSFVGGLWLSWSGNYKTTTFVIYLFSFVSMIIYTVVFEISLWIIFVMAACLGFFMTGYLPVGFEFAAEITYPAPEGTSSGLLNCSAQLFGFLLTQLMGVVLDASNPVTANGFIAAWLFVGTVMTFFIKSDLRRTTITNSMRSTASFATNVGDSQRIDADNIQMAVSKNH